MIRQIQLTVNKFESDLECFDPPCGQGVLGFARCQLQQGFFAFVQRSLPVWWESFWLSAGPTEIVALVGRCLR